jgi:hypothetical protein
MTKKIDPLEDFQIAEKVFGGLPNTADRARAFELWERVFDKCIDLHGVDKAAHLADRAVILWAKRLELVT